MFTVYNLSTNEERRFMPTLSPAQAVQHCYAEERNMLPAFYAGKQFDVIEGSRSVSCGDWTARV